jgi:transcription elongation factor GreB
MSKAFTSEETEDTGPVGRAPPRAGETRPITREGKRALEAELRGVQSARAALGAGLRDLSAIEVAARREELVRKEELLSAILATVIEVAKPSDRTRVSFGCTVTLEDERGKKRRYTLVGPDETDAKAGRISTGSPLGRALLDQKVGDEVELERPRGTELVTVRAIKV